MDNLELKIILKKLKLTQVQMTEKLGVSLKGYQNWEQGDRRIPKAAEFLLNTLLKEKESRENTRIPLLVKEGVNFNLGGAIDLIVNNLEEAEENPMFNLYRKSVFQEGEKTEKERQINKLLQTKVQ